MARYLTQSNINAEAGIDIKELTSALKAFDIFESRLRRESIFSATRAAMTPYVVDAKQAAISELTTLNSRARRQMANSIGIKSDNIGKRGKAIAWAIVGPVMGRELTRPRKRTAGSNGQFDYAKMAGWFGGKGGVAAHVTGSKGGKHPGIKATPVWEKLFIANTRQIISRFNNNLTKELQDAVKEAYNKTQKRQARQQKAFQKAIGGGGG